VAKLADALDLGSSGEIHGGSSPFARTKKKSRTLWSSFFGGRPFKAYKKVCFNKCLFFTINNQLEICCKQSKANKILKNVRVVNVNIKCHENFIVKMS
jgi:hypothetical protein